MKIYFAAPTGKRRDMLLKEYGNKYGACQTRDVFSTPHLFNKWFFDNGAFSDWKKGKMFNSSKFFNRIEQIESMIAQNSVTRPQFIVIPDQVAGGMKSFFISRAYLHGLKEDYPENKYYLAVQDGMRMHYIEDGKPSVYSVEFQLMRGNLSGIFVGGTKEWKKETGAQWCDLAHKYGVQCHAGGVGSKKMYVWAKLCGFDSVDSGLPMIHSKHLQSALNIEETYSQNLFLRAA